MRFAYTNNIYLAVIFILSLIVCMPWLWRYRIEPRLAKIALNKQLKKHIHWQQINITENFLNQLYKKINPDKISRTERKRLARKEYEFFYGEIDFLSFFTILNKIKPQPSEVFYDLGSGAGKAIFTAAMFFDFRKVCGIELIPGLYSAANNLIKKAKTLVKTRTSNFDKSFLKKISSIQFVNENFIDCNLSDADIVFINATCLRHETWSLIMEKLLNLKPGSRVIVTTKKIENDQFDILSQSRELMSWGLNSVNIYRKK